MMKRDRLDGIGILALTGFAALFALNQVVVKVATGGFQPLFMAALRSAGVMPVLLIWMYWRDIPVKIERGQLRDGLLIGSLFAGEFTFFFLALDLTTVTRSSVVFYAMPIWLAVGAHFLLPDQRLTRLKVVGLLLGFSGVAYALISQGGTDVAVAGSLAGDLCALVASVFWAGIALCARGSSLRHASPEMQLMWQVAVSAPILFALSFWFGDWIRDLQVVHLLSLGFQTVVVVTAGFVGWLWVLSIYPPASVAAFSFLTPVFGIVLGWLLLGEPIGIDLLIAAALLVTGLTLINRPG